MKRIYGFDILNCRENLLNIKDIFVEVEDLYSGKYEYEFYHNPKSKNSYYVFRLNDDNAIFDTQWKLSNPHKNPDRYQIIGMSLRFDSMEKILSLITKLTECTERIKHFGFNIVIEKEIGQPDITMQNSQTGGIYEILFPDNPDPRSRADNYYNFNWNKDGLTSLMVDRWNNKRVDGQRLLSFKIILTKT